MIGILEEYRIQDLSDNEKLIILVTLMALIRRPEDLDRSFSLNVIHGSTVNNVLSELGYTKDEIRFFLLYITDDQGETEKISKKYILQQNDELFVSIPVGGGL